MIYVRLTLGLCLAGLSACSESKGLLARGVASLWTRFCFAQDLAGVPTTLCSAACRTPLSRAAANRWKTRKQYRAYVCASACERRRYSG